MKFNLILCAVLMLAIPGMLFADPYAANSDALKNAVILIIRHAEKPESGSGLTADGEARAQAYVHYFGHFTVDGQPLKLDYLFAAADSKNSRRPRLTIEPTARAFGLAIDIRFKDKDVQGLADELQSRPHGRAILIAWHHEQIPALLQALGANPAQVIPDAKWPGSVLGWLIQLRYDPAGKLIEVKRINENLMPDDLNKHATAAT